MIQERKKTRHLLESIELCCCPPTPRRGSEMHPMHLTSLTSVMRRKQNTDTGLHDGLDVVLAYVLFWFFCICLFIFANPETFMEISAAFQNKRPYAKVSMCTWNLNRRFIIYFLLRRNVDSITIFKYHFTFHTAHASLTRASTK